MIILFIAVLTGGCLPQRNERVFKEAHRKLVEMEGYSCTAEIYIKGNKKPGEYKVKQWFKVPDKYRVEVLEPGELKGKLTVCDGDRVWLYYPYIDQVFLLENVNSISEDNLFAGFFLKDLMNTEEIEYSFDEKEGQEVIVIEFPPAGGNKYRHVERLYISKRGFIPVLLEVCDVEGNVTTRVKYDSFDYNPKLDPELFQLRND